MRYSRPDMRRTFDACAMSLMFSIAMCVAAQAPPTLKLPDTVVPLAYDLQLKLDATASTYSGTVAIDVRIAASTDLVWINATDLQVDDVRAVNVSASGDVIGGNVVAGNTDVIGLRFARPLPAGDVRLTLRFAGTFSTTNVAGLFRQKDRDDWYVLTQHEPMYARRAFPCFDEPRFRAAWRIVLTVPEGQRAFSNMPIDAERASAPGWREVSFGKSPPIASYLVAIAVGPWDVLDGGTAGKNATPLRYIAPKGRAAEAAYAASVTPAIVERLEAYFGEPFPFPKLDSIAMPNSGFFFGAMENVGLITYDQSILLATPAEDTTNFRQEYVSTAAHEIAHQWFGNLVTPAWWDDIWLNESFATWMGNRITDEVKPEWHWNFMRGRLRQAAIENDRLASARRVRQPIEVRSDIISAFDAISYQKGAALLAMFEDWLGPDKFRDGVRRYMAKHAWGVATADDFFAALAAEDEVVMPAFRAFVDRPGVPALAVDLDCSGDPTLHLSQSRFAPKGSTIDPQVRWTFPACFKFGAAKGKEHCAIVRDAKTDLKLATTTCPAWVIANRTGVGYFLPVLSSRLNAKLPSAAPTLGPLDWVFLLGDTNILAGAAAIPQPEALELAAIAARQSDPRVYRQASAIAGDVPPELTQGANRMRYAKWVRAHFGPRARELGWQPRAGEDADTQRLRRELLPLVADRGEDVVLARDARTRVMRWPKDVSAVPAEVRHELLWTAARTADNDAAVLYVHIASVAKSTPDMRTRRDALHALGGFRAPTQQRDALRLVLEDTFEPLESLQILSGALENESARAGALTWIDRNFDALAKRVAGDNLRGLSFWASAACSADERALFVAALSERMRNVDGGPRTYAKTLERIDLCVAYRAAQEGPLDRWLVQRQGAALTATSRSAGHHRRASIGSAAGEFQRRGRRVVLGQHVRHLPRRQRAVRDVAQELVGHLAEVRFVADVIGRGNRDFPTGVRALQADPGVFRLHLWYSAFERGRERCRIDRRERLYVEHGLIALLLALPDHQIAIGAAHHRIVGIAGTGGRFEVPDDRYLRVHAADGVVDFAVGIRVQAAVRLHILAQIVGNACELRHAGELRGTDRRRPAPRAQHANVLAIINDLVRETFPLHEIDQVRGDVDQAFALLRGVEEPGRPLDWSARHQLGKVMHAFLGDRGIFLRAGDQSAEYRSDGRELLLQHGRNLVPLGHDVVEQHAAIARYRERLVERREARLVDRHRLVGEGMHARRNRARQVFGLAPVVA